MARRARRAGFERAATLGWNERREIGDGAAIECLPAGLSNGLRANAYLLTTSSASIYVSTEARDLAPITELAQRRRVDVAILPIDGLRFAGRRLVLNAAEALDAARLLGARTLVPIHYSQRSVRGLISCTSGIDELLRLARRESTVRVSHGPAGTCFSVDGSAGG